MNNLGEVNAMKDSGRLCLSQVLELHSNYFFFLKIKKRI